jgi:hypothetical protein
MKEARRDVSGWGGGHNGIDFHSGEYMRILLAGKVNTYRITH